MSAFDIFVKKNATPTSLHTSAKEGFLLEKMGEGF